MRTKDLLLRLKENILLFDGAMGTMLYAKGIYFNRCYDELNLSNPEIVKEIKLAIQDAARDLSRFLSGKRKAGEQKRRLQIFERYAEEVADSIAKLTGKDGRLIEKNLKDLIKNRLKVRDENEEDNSG